MSLLGIDIGTSNIKGVVFDYSGNVIAKMEKPYSLITPCTGWCEVDAGLFISAFKEITNGLAGLTGEDPVIALALTSHGETVIPVDRSGAPVCNGFMHADSRGYKEVEELEGRLGRKRIYEITGTPPHPVYGLSNIMWLKKNRPESYAAAYKFCSCEDFILMNLGLPPTCNYSNCSRLLIFDIKKRQWSQEILEAAGVDINKLSEPVSSGQIIGKLDADIARELGLNKGVTVVSGGFDHFCSSIGSGVFKPGTASCSAGSYEGLVVISDEPSTSEEALNASMNNFCHMDGRIANFMYFPSGFSPKWFVNEMCGADKIEAEKQGISVFELLEKKVAGLEDKPTNIFITPHYVGSCCPYNDIRATATIVGITPSASRHHMYKAVYEGIAYEFSILSQLMDGMTTGFDRVRINGGGARSEFTLHMRANTSGKIIDQLDTNEAPCLGAAMLAGTAVGVFRDMEDAVQKAVRIRMTAYPDEAKVRSYERPKEIYKTIYKSLAPVREMTGL